jgi:ribosome-associated translation inhibitor RaiA
MTIANSVEIAGVDAGPRVAALARRRLAEELERLTVTPVRARVTFFDDDGPKGGPAVRCAITVHLPYRPALRVEHSAGTARLAVDGATEALGRRLAKYREEQRERRRRPKKYYAAKRLLP